MVGKIYAETPIDRIVEFIKMEKVAEQHVLRLDKECSEYMFVKRNACRNMKLNKSVDFIVLTEMRWSSF